MKNKSQIRPTYIAYAASSIDGRIALTKTKMPDWTSKEDWNFFQSELGKADAVVVGRTTYRVAANRLRRRQTYVLSSQLKSITRRGTVTFVNPNSVSLEKLLSGYSRIAIVGGAVTYQSMIKRGLLDEFYVTFEPVIFGRGQTMIAGGKETTNFTLVSMRRLNVSGTILLHYKIIKNHDRNSR